MLFKNRTRDLRLNEAIAEFFKNVTVKFAGLDILLDEF
jgi:hypothetical protein